MEHEHPAGMLGPASVTIDIRAFPGVLLVGDRLGVVDGEPVRAPARFTSDAAQAERSLHRLLEVRGSRTLIAHGPEIDDPWPSLDRLLVDA